MLLNSCSISEWVKLSATLSSLSQVCVAPWDKGFTETSSKLTYAYSSKFNTTTNVFTLETILIGLKIPIVTAICRVTVAIKLIFLHAPSRVPWITRSGTSKIGAWLWLTPWETSEKGTAGKRVFMCCLKDDTFYQGSLIHKESSRISELGA